MSDEYNHNLPKAAYRASLLAELNTVPMPREKKAAIVEELERLGQRTADEDRAAMEAAVLGPVTVGRAPSSVVIQDPTDADGSASTVITPASPAQTSVASTSKAKQKEPIDASPEVESEDEAVEL